MPHIKSSPTAGHTGRLKSNYILGPNGKALALAGATGAAITRKSGASSGNFLKDAWDGVTNWFGGGLGKPGKAKKGGGFTGWISNALSTGEGMTGLGNLLSVGGTFISTLFDDSAEKQHELDTRKLDLYEEFSREELRINEMRAKDAIRQTGIASTFMGWTNPIAAVEGVVEPTPGLTVAAPVSPSEVSYNTGGIIGGNNQGLITQAQQRVAG